MPSLRFLAVLLATAIAAAAHAQVAPDVFQGLPAGGGLDDARVVELRYGKADAAAPGGAAAPAAAQAQYARIPDALATIGFESGSGQEQTAAPVSFGQVFGPGVLKRGQRLQARLAGGAVLPLQTDVKARHPDGSVRHAVLSLVLDRVARGQRVVVGLFAATAAQDEAAAAPAALSSLLNRGFDARIEVRLDGKTYGLALRPLLDKRAPAPWLDGPLAREWQAAAPLLDAGGRPHPHLAARFAVRWYPGADKARVEVGVENDWAFEPAPRNFSYDARITVAGKEVHAEEGMKHHHHARWRKLFWWGAEGDAGAVHVRHDTRQLIASMALPNYDQSLRVDQRTLESLYAGWRKARSAPMGTGLAMHAMPATGGRIDIGLLPGWAVMHLLGMDPRAAEMNLGTADMAGHWSMHYRDRRTGLPVSPVDYPYMTLLGRSGDTLNPATGKSEGFPGCAPGACDTPNDHDVAHQPSFSYLPYLLTGDHYHLEELQFWAMYSVFNSNPGYRETHKGLLKPEQVRGQAWGLRTLGQAAYITPDAHPLKGHFVRMLDHNLDWYNAEYTSNPRANRLGIIVNGYALEYQEKRAVAPWQDDFFTSAVGHLAELGFAKARPLLRWKAAFPAARMNGMCWIDGAIYSLTVRENASAPFYGSIGEAYRAAVPAEMRAMPCGGAEMASALKLRVGEMTGFSSSEVGFPSNMQPALAYAADALGEPGMKAWRQFMARSVKPNYGAGPQFAIVPRALSRQAEEVEQR